MARMVLALGALALALADLPVHCLRSQVQGEWVFKLGPEGQDKNSIRCSAQKPEYGKKEANFGLGSPNFKPVDNMVVQLQHPNNVTYEDTHGKVHYGTWTMMYDEAFEVRIHGHRFFAYFKFVEKDNHDESHCGEVFPGWDHPADNIDGKTWRCFTAQKTKDIPEPVKFRKFGSKPVTAAAALLVQEDRAVDYINNHPDSTWTARKYSEQPHPLALGQLLRSYRKFDKPEGLIEERVETSDLPASFDWRDVNGRNFVDPVINQGDCGSCYSVAVSSMISCRAQILAKKTGTEYRASPQSVLSQCGFYAQGCQGGFPFAASKYAMDFGVTSWDKVKYIPTDQQGACPTEDDLVAVVQDYMYVGGFYGACSEKHMLRELYDQGPFVVGIEVAPGMSMYQTGVFSTKIRLPDQDHYERVNHAVLIVGYGEDTGKDGQSVKYWWVKNSWGDFWGDQGFFKVLRGQNVMNIEHMAVAAYPALVRELPAKGSKSWDRSKCNACEISDMSTSDDDESRDKESQDEESQDEESDKILDPAFQRAQAGETLLEVGETDVIVQEGTREFVEFE